MPTSSQALHLLKQVIGVNSLELCSTSSFLSAPAMPYPPPKFQMIIDGAPFPISTLSVPPVSETKGSNVSPKHVTLPPIVRYLKPCPSSILKTSSKPVGKQKEGDVTLLERENDADDSIPSDSEDKKQQSFHRKRVGLTSLSCREKGCAKERKGLSYVSVIWYNEAKPALQKQPRSNLRKLRFSDEIDTTETKTANQTEVLPVKSLTCLSNEFTAWGDDGASKRTSDNFNDTMSTSNGTMEMENVSFRAPTDATSENFKPCKLQRPEKKKALLVGNTLNLNIDVNGNKSGEELTSSDRTSCMGIMCFSPRSGRHTWNLQPHQYMPIRHRGWSSNRTMPLAICSSGFNTSADLTVCKLGAVGSRWKSSQNPCIYQITQNYPSEEQEKRFVLSQNIPVSEGTVISDEDIMAIIAGHPTELRESLALNECQGFQAAGIISNQSQCTDQTAKFFMLPAIDKHIHGNKENTEGGLPVSNRAFVSSLPCDKLQRLTCSGVINKENVAGNEKRGLCKVSHRSGSLATSAQNQVHPEGESKVDSDTARTFTGLTQKQKRLAEFRKREPKVEMPVSVDEEAFWSDYTRNHAEDSVNHSEPPRPIKHTMPVVIPPSIEEMKCRPNIKEMMVEDEESYSDDDGDDSDVDSTCTPMRSVKSRVLRMRASLPPARPNRLCFKTSLSGCTHVEVKSEIESQKNVIVTWLQYDPVSLQARSDHSDSYLEHCCMWMFELKDDADINRLLLEGFLLRDMKMRIRVLDDVYEEEYRAYCMCNEIYSEHCSKRLAKACWRRKMALTTK